MNWGSKKEGFSIRGKISRKDPASGVIHKKNHQGGFYVIALGEGRKLGEIIGGKTEGTKSTQRKDDFLAFPRGTFVVLGVHLRLGL